MREDALLKKFEAEMIECAQRALASPQNRDAFEYGRMAGIYGGLARAREIVIAALDDADKENI